MANIVAVAQPFVRDTDDFGFPIPLWELTDPTFKLSGSVESFAGAANQQKLESKTWYTKIKTHVGLGDYELQTTKPDGFCGYSAIDIIHRINGDELSTDMATMRPYDVEGWIALDVILNELKLEGNFFHGKPVIVVRIVCKWDYVMPMVHCIAAIYSGEDFTRPDTPLPKDQLRNIIATNNEPMIVVWEHLGASWFTEVNRTPNPRWPAR